MYSSTYTSYPSYTPRRPRRVIPNMPDVILRKIFGYLSYKELVPLEGVCRRWQSIILIKLRREIHEISMERLGVCGPSVVQMKAFRRLTVQCPLSCTEFLAGVLRRSRLSLAKMTTDIEFLALIAQLRIAKEEYRKYFSNCDDLWLLIVSCSDETLRKFLDVEESLFTELQTLTLQVHVNSRDNHNVGRLIAAFSHRYPTAEINLELHASKSKLVFDQIREIPSVPMNKVKIICTEYDLPQLRLDELYNVMKEKCIMAKNVSMRDWSLYSDGTSPVSHLPLDTYRISCCTIETVDNLVKSLHMTSEQERPKVKKKIVKRKKPELETPSEEEEKPKKKVVKKMVKKKKPSPYIKKLEIAGQCTLAGLQFLEKKAHTELEKRLVLSVPEMVVDCSEIYYCF